MDVVPKQRPSRGSAEAWHKGFQSLEEVDGPICDILRRFSGVRGPIPISKSIGRPTEPDRSLLAANLNYYAISKLGGLQLCFVDSICMHLELDSREKRLHIFASPSFCAMLCRAHKTSSVFDL